MLELTIPEQKRAVYRKEKGDLCLEKLIRKISKNKIEFSSDFDYLKTLIFTEDIKIEALKLLAYPLAYWADHKPESDAIFTYYERRKEELKPYSLFGDITLEQVLKHFE